MTIKINNKSLSRTGKVSKAILTKKRSYTRNTTLSIARSSRSRINIGIKKSSNKFSSFIFKFICVICLVVGLVIGFNYSKNYLYAYAIIDSIEIEGCNNVGQSEIIKILPFQVGESLWQIDLGEAEKKLSDYKKELKKISMHKKWSWGIWPNNNKVIVSLKERVPEVFISFEDKKMGLDFDNVPFNLRGNMFSMKIPNLVFNNDDERQNLLIFFQKVKNKINNLIPKITEIKYGEVEDIVLTLNNELSIYWGSPKEHKIEEKSYKLQKILDDLSEKKIDAKSIDLSFLDNNKDMILVKKFIDKENKVNVQE